MIKVFFLDLPWKECCDKKFFFEFALGGRKVLRKSICLGTALDGGKACGKTLFTQHRLYPTLTQDFKRFNLVLSSANPAGYKPKNRSSPKNLLYIYHFNNTNVFTRNFLDHNKNIFLGPPIPLFPARNSYYCFWPLVFYIVKPSIHPYIDLTPNLLALTIHPSTHQSPKLNIQTLLEKPYWTSLTHLLKPWLDKNNPAG